MDKLQIMRSTVDFQMKVSESIKKDEEVSLSQINELLLSKRVDFSANSISLCISKQNIPITDDITGLPSVVATQKFDKDFAVVIDISKLSNIDTLDSFISTLNLGQSQSKDLNRLAVVMANIKEGQDTKEFDSQLMVPTLQNAVDNFFVGA